jgi:hypothetical protein
MFCLCLDKQLSSGETVRGEAANELIGKAYGNKCQGVSPVGRRVERPVNREVRWRVPENERSLVETPGKPMGKTAFDSKSGQHRTLVQLGELTERADPEPPEHVGEHGQAEDLHRKVTEPLRRRATRHYQAFACGEPRSKRPVGDPHLARWLRGGSAGRTGYGHDGCSRCVTDLLGQRNLPTEIAGGGPDRQGTDPGPGELHAGREARHRYHDGLEAARVPSRFLAHHNELRTARLCFPAALPETHPFRPGGRGGGDHPVGGEDNSRPVGEPGSNKWPIRAPDDKGANRRHH